MMRKIFSFFSFVSYLAYNDNYYEMERIADFRTKDVYKRQVKGSPAVGMEVQEMKFPESVRIMLISRGSGTLTPTGKTRIKEGDMLMVTAENTGVLLALKERLGLA